MELTSLSNAVWRTVGEMFRFGLTIQSISYVLVPFGAFAAFRQLRARQPGPTGFKAFMRYCVSFDSSSTWGAKFRSMRLDIGFIIIKRFVTDWLLVPVLFTSAVTAALTYKLFINWFGDHGQVPAGWLASAFVLAVAVVVSDFVQFMVHYVHHRNATLWDVHKVHHSTEFMAFSFSTKRTHAIEEVINTALTAGFVGVAIGVLCYLLRIPVWDSMVYGVDAWFLLQLMSFWHLRHSHMSLSYGWLENIFQSPAMHHLHHSAEPRHRGKNFGLLFSVWDRMFGSFERSVDPTTFRLGLAPRDRGDYDTVFKLYVTPFRKMSTRIKRSLLSNPAHGTVRQASPAGTSEGKSAPQPVH